MNMSMTVRALVRRLRQRDDSVLSVYNQRKANPTDKKDILNMMMNGKDKETGQGLSEQVIKNNVSCLSTFCKVIHSSQYLISVASYVPHCRTRDYLRFVPLSFHEGSP